MKRVLVDINIILDMLTKREDHESAAGIFELCSKKSLKGYLCSHEITTLSYFLAKFSYSKQTADQVIVGLLNTFTIIPTTETILRDALNSPIGDYEDAVIEVSALKEEVDCIVTRNLSDFKSGRADSYTAAEVLSLLAE